MCPVGPPRPNCQAQPVAARPCVLPPPVLTPAGELASGQFILYQATQLESSSAGVVRVACSHFFDRVAAHANPGRAVMRLIPWFAALTLPAALCGCWDTDISGTYVGGNGREADLIQVVQGADGHLLGRFAYLEMKPDGKIQQGGGALDGAYRGGNVVVTLHVIPIIASVTLSGTADANRIDLAASLSEGPSTMSLVRSDEADFQARAEKIRQAGRLAQAAQAQATAARVASDEAGRLAAAILALTKHEQAFAVRTARLPSAIINVENHYRAITGRMQALLERQQSIWGGGQATVTRSQISIAINQAAIATSQYHIRVGQEERALGNEYAPVVREAIVAENKCASDQPFSSVATACAAFRGIDGAFQKQIAAERDGFAEVEDFYREEKAKQDVIQQQAQNTVNRM